MTGKHPKPCLKCKVPTYTASGICRYCAPSRVGRPPAAFPLPSVCPEDYLLACVAELAERHRARAETLARVGIVFLPSPVPGEGAETGERAA